MGYALCTSACLCCSRTFMYNPMRVPSFRVNGVREPICRQCFDDINEKRKAHGLPVFERHADAYDPIDEAELP